MRAGLKTAYGLELSDELILLARVSRRGSSQVVLSAPLAAPETARALQQAEDEVARGAAVLAVAAPAAHTAVRRLRAPFASPKKAARIWPALLDVELPFPVESACCCYGTARVEQGGTIGVAAAMRNHDLAAFLDACRTRGFDPTHCDAEALALWSQQAVETPPVRMDRPRAVVWLGPDHVTIARGHGAEFIAAHVLRASPLSGDPAAFDALWTARAAQILGTHLAESGQTEMDVWWAGPGAVNDTLVTRLRRLLPADLAIRHETCRQPASMLARALARRAADESGMNFRSGEWMHPALGRTRAKELKNAYIGVITVALLVLGLNLGESILRRRQTETLQRRLTVAAQVIAGSRIPRGQERLMVERAIAARAQETLPFRQALDPEGMEGRLARIVEAASASGVELSRLGLSSATISMEGSAPDIQDIERLAERVRALGWAVQSDSPGRTPAGHPRFILKGQIHHEE
ncbi:MAG: hypothetical protein KBC66_02115 [Kiritimatiellae bacterium]|nr:hypothetical protein [Kiritimatiellia bacterium]NLD89885.1 hypothetical protein [Lentisphaerota bacterium]HQN80355.1 hypothetical protein [Kiritimatiellia bacterium]